ncbi:glycosyltransferase [Nonomuraea sp. M3C6]|uniref:Glycosyltransferase n=1 Tax=Nonomuraea marmarensis TaxID=3351344 RepID=A0ABW7AQE5_9ACTN
MNDKAAGAWSLPSPWRDVRVAVVVPTYNEAGNIGELAERIFALDLPNLRLIIADDDSPDGTGALADDLAKDANDDRPDRMVVLHRKVKEGIGRAHIAGMLAALARGDEYVVQMDGDLSHRPEYIPHLLGTILATQAGVVPICASSWGARSSRCRSTSRNATPAPARSASRPGGVHAHPVRAALRRARRR